MGSPKKDSFASVHLASKEDFDVPREQPESASVPVIDSFADRFLALTVEEGESGGEGYKRFMIKEEKAIAHRGTP